jgi:formamidopyrimidine-DNA glycosylase
LPELPDITVYVEALQKRLVGQPLNEVRLKIPFLHEQSSRRSKS